DLRGVRAHKAALRARRGCGARGRRNRGGDSGRREPGCHSARVLALQPSGIGTTFCSVASGDPPTRSPKEGKMADDLRTVAPVEHIRQAPVEHLPQDARKHPQKGIGLCLSGGGYRAMLFHLGALWRPNELGYLPKLARVSSVSGGSTVQSLGRALSSS